VASATLDPPVGIPDPKLPNHRSAGRSAAAVELDVDVDKWTRQVNTACSNAPHTASDAQSGPRRASRACCAGGQMWLDRTAPRV
jgi:hypothetical protein